MKLGLAGGYYISGQNVQNECQNYYPEAIITPNQKRTSLQLVATAGLSTFSTPGSSPVRAMQEMGGVLYVVSDDLYSISSSGTAKSLGTIAGGTVCMAYNATAPRQLLIIVGGMCDFIDNYFIVAGTIAAGYIYDTINGLVPISDADFPLGDNGQEFFTSNLLDGKAWTATDSGSAETDPDRVTGLIVNHDEVIVFGSRTYEIFVNQSAGASFPLVSRGGTAQERGTVSKDSVKNLDNTVYFLGDDRIVYRIDGYLPTRVSDHSIETQLGTYSEAELVAATALTYTQNGHYFYCLTIGGDTWVYDASTSGLVGVPMWHQRKTLSTSWRAQHSEQAHGQVYFGGTDGRISRLLFTAEDDNGDRITRIRSIGAISAPNDHSVGLSRVILENSYVPGSAVVTMEVSKDGVSWGNKRERGLRGETIWRAIGPSRNHYLRWTVSDAAEHTLYEAYGTLADGGS